MIDLNGCRSRLRLLRSGCRRGTAPRRRRRARGPALADIACSPRAELAERAQAALQQLLPHEALILVPPGSRASALQVAAPPPLSERLAEAEWWRLCGKAQLAHGEACRLD